MNEHIIAVCDSSEKYALNISSLLISKLQGIYQVSTFTSVDNLIEYSVNNAIDIILISENMYDMRINQASPKKLLILRENPDFVLEGVTFINRFQCRDDILHSVLENISEYEGAYSVERLKIHQWKIIGVYSPVRRCLQTTFAMTLGQMLAKENKVLYMNFENYSGFSGLLKTEFESDISDLLYFFDCAKEKMPGKLSLMIRRIGDLDILPPAKSYLEISNRTGMAWVEFIREIEKITEYDYLILDLTDSLQDLPDVLGICNRIYTMTQNDPISKAKLKQYEDWLVDHSKAEIISRTMKFNFPIFTNIPEDPSLLTHSELAAYVNAIISEDSFDEDKQI